MYEKYEKCCLGSPLLRLDHGFVYLLLYKRNHGKRKRKTFVVGDEGKIVGLGASCLPGTSPENLLCCQEPGGLGFPACVGAG